MLRLLVSALIATCAIGPVAMADDHVPEGFEDDPRLGEEVRRMCFSRNVSGFGETTRRTIVLRARVNEYYLVETFGFCRDLDWAQSIALDSFGPCLTRGDTIHTSDSVFASDRRHGLANQCRVRAIYDWDPDAQSEDESDPETEPAAEPAPR